MDICDSCAYLVYDEEWEAYVCDACPDEDEMARLLSGNARGCPYYRNGDEYKIVRRQI